MNESVLKYLSEQSAETKKRITLHFAAEVDEFSFLTAKLIETLKNYNVQNFPQDDGDPKLAAFGLMTKGANTLMAGFELILVGYTWEPPILFRSALEVFAAGWDIVRYQDRFAVWKDGKKFDSTNSISNVRRDIPPFGQLYGYLSNMHVHTRPLNSSPAMFVIGQEPKFKFFGLIRPGKEDTQKGEIYFALLVAYVCLQLTELTFYAYSLGLETIELKPGPDRAKVKVSARHRQFVDTASQVFKTMSEDPTAFL